MDKIFKAKEIYNSVPIPPELESVVNDAIARGNSRTAKKLSAVKPLASVAVCAVICLAVGLTAPLFGKKTPENAGLSLARTMPDGEMVITESAAAPALNAPVLYDTPYGTMISEWVREEKEKGNEPELIYCDENFVSFSVVTVDGEIEYYNFREGDEVENITLPELGIFDFSENADFYISGRNTAVVICDGEEVEIMFGGAR